MTLVLLDSQNEKKFKKSSESFKGFVLFATLIKSNIVNDGKILANRNLNVTETYFNFFNDNFLQIGKEVNEFEVEVKNLNSKFKKCDNDAIPNEPTDKQY